MTKGEEFRKLLRPCEIVLTAGNSGSVAAGTNNREANEGSFRPTSLFGDFHC
jgi:hypothetical protein